MCSKKFLEPIEINSVAIQEVLQQFEEIHNQAIRNLYETQDAFRSRNRCVLIPINEPAKGNSSERMHGVEIKTPQDAIFVTDSH